MPSFLTGSQVYGKPHDLSDVDLVMLLPKEIISELYKYSSDKHTLRFGRLNLLALDEADSEHVNFFNQWRQVTEELIKRKPVTREEAIQARKDAGIGSLPNNTYFNEE